jgi:hypothetical protein
MLSESFHHITKKSFMEILKLSQGRERVQPGGETPSLCNRSGGNRNDTAKTTDSFLY